jgi:DNA-binding GntR family transcriptional regulator
MLKMAPIDQQKAGAGGRPAVVHEEVYQRLRRAIIAGQLEPGRSVSVRGLAAEFGVSAMPAREAIRQLAALGALELTETRRVRVARISEEKLREIADARVALEPALAGRALDAANRKTGGAEKLAGKLASIDEALDKAIARGDSAAYARHNSDFHFTLYQAAQSPVYLGLVESLWLQVGPYMRVVIGRLGTSSMVDQHQEAIRAVKASDRQRLEAAVRDDIVEGMTWIADAGI